MFRSFILILLILSTSACTKYTYYRASPNYKKTLLEAKTAVLLPPIVEVKSLDTFGKATKKYNYEDHLEKTIVEVLIPKLKKKGLNLEFLSRRKIGENQLSRAIVDIKHSYNNVMKELYSGGPWKEDKALFIKHTLRGATPIYDTLNTDLVVILDFYVQSKTSGAMTRDVTLAVLSEALIGIRTNIEPAEISTMRIAIVHAPTGRVLWAHNIYQQSDVISTTVNSFSDADKVNKKTLNAIFDSAFEDLPTIRARKPILNNPETQQNQQEIEDNKQTTKEEKTKK